MIDKHKDTHSLSCRFCGNIDFGLYAALLFLGLFPAVFMTLRTFFFGQLPDGSAYSIAGQLSWVSLLYEIVDEALILPLFFFLGGEHKEGFDNRLRSGLALTTGIYVAFAVILNVFLSPLMRWMAVPQDIMRGSMDYIRLESLAYIPSALFSFAMVALVTIGDRKGLYLLTVAKCALGMLLDAVLLSSLPVSLGLGVNGAAWSTMISSIVMFLIVVWLLHCKGHDVFSTKKMSFSWMEGVVRVSCISGIESFVRNIAYIVMVSKMVNMVGEQGTYWVANNFIWGWLLLPILQLGELIKRDVAVDAEKADKSLRGYFMITGVICAMWVALIPMYKPFMAGGLGYDDVSKLFRLVIMLLPFYMLFALQNVFDSFFYGAGRTDYMLFEAVVTNTVYYGSFYLAYRTGVWVPSLDGIALMFGFGNLFDSIVSGIAFWHFRRNKAHLPLKKKH